MKQSLQLINLQRQIEAYGKSTTIKAIHSQYNETFKGRFACGMPIIPIRSKLQGPASIGFQANTTEDIIDEAFQLFRINVLFKNFEIKGPGDKVLIYLLVFLSYLFKSTESLKELSQVQKKLSEINAMPNPLPKQKTNFLSPLLDDTRGPELDTYLAYVKQLKAETINRFIAKFYQDGFPVEDFKFWCGFARKKFMGLNFVSLF